VELRGKDVIVVGMGRSAMGAVDLLLREGAAPFVTDAAPPSALAGSTEALKPRGVAFETGGHAEAARRIARAREAAGSAAAMLVVLSPGVPPDLPFLAEAREAGIPVLGELELAARFAAAPILAVTGTNGKTTVTELLHAMIAACGHRVLLAGNNATPLSSAVLAPTPEYYVLEVSSYQLETTRKFRPWIGAVLNLTPDHLGRHKTMEQYAAVKRGLFARQQQGDTAILNADDRWTSAMTPPAGVAAWQFSTKRRVAPGLWLDGQDIRDGGEAVAALSDLRLPGRHNQQNALAALAMMRAGGFDWERTLDGLRAFRGVEHRLEMLGSLDGVDYCNDSKSTNVESLRVALESFSHPLILIAGGRGKEASDYEGLAPLLRQRVKAVVVLGEEAPRLAAAWGGTVPVEQVTAMDAAVAIARARADSGDVVLLSPGCASFDQYRNFEERGRHFKALFQEFSLDAATAKENAS